MNNTGYSTDLAVIAKVRDRIKERYDINSETEGTDLMMKDEDFNKLVDVTINAMRKSVTTLVDKSKIDEVLKSNTLSICGVRARRLV